MRAWMTFALLAAAPTAGLAANALVLDPEGAPVSDAVVMCSAHARDALLTDAEGRALLPDGCRAVTCMRGPHLPGRAVVVEGSAVCRLIAGTRVILRMDATHCGAHCVALLRPVEEEGDRASGPLTPNPATGSLEARLDPVRPGAYTGVVYDSEQDWLCQGPVELSRAGEAIVNAGWRPPFELEGVVVTESGDPAADIPIRTRAVVDAENATPPSWLCKRDEAAPDRYSAADGSFRAPVDPGGRTVIEAGSVWDPDGHVVIEVGPSFPESLTLRLRRARK